LNVRTLTTWDDLQTLIGTTSEGADLDFKEILDLSKGSKAHIEFAKDIAALANVLGGHVLVGASTEMHATRCTGFHGIDNDVAAKVTKVFEEQVRDRCRPTPVFSVRSVDVPGASSVVVIITVESSPVAPVGVCLRQESGGHLVDRGWAFPCRVGSLTEYLHPDQFGVYESMSARRAAALLNSIPGDQRQLINLRWVVGEAMPPGSGYGDGQTHHFESLKARFDHVDLLGNVASFTELAGQCPISLPLDQIQTVWRKTKKGEMSWEVSIFGSLHQDDDEWQLWPPT
jgi:hypothetical protein